MSDYTYPDEFIRKAEARIRKQVSGNGVAPKSIKLNVKRQGIGEFSATTTFDVDVSVSQSFDKGKITKGQLIEAGQTQSQIDQFKSEFQNGDDINRTAKDHIKTLPLKGFGAEKIQIPLKDHKKIFTEHVTCGRCNGQGQSQCKPCSGRGRCQCRLCYGQGLVNCMYCKGMGQIPDGDLMKPCFQCQGKKQVFCTQCQGQREEPCATCQTRGVTTCGDCNGGGANSSHTTIEPFLKISSAIHIQELDAEPKTFAAKVTPIILAKGGHIDIEEIQPPDTDEKPQPSELSYYQDDDVDYDNVDKNVYYSASVPWAVAGVEVDNKPYNVAFIGKKGAVCDAGHFMDDILDKSFTLFRDAAQGNGFVAGLLKDACNSRVSRETLSALATMNRKKAMATLSKQYSIGLTKSSLKAFVQHGYLALKRITRRPRYIGLCVGLTISAALYYYWFMNGGRMQTTEHPLNIRYAMDTIPLCLGIILTVISIKGAGFFVFKNLMRDIGINTNKMPALGTAGLYAFIGNLLLWGGIFGFKFFLT